MAPTPLRERLEAAFGFDDGDVAANRTGRLSSRQLARLREERRDPRLAIGFAGLVVVGSVLLIVRSNSPADLPVAAVLFGALSLAAYSARNGLRIRTVSIADGIAAQDGAGVLRLGEATLVL